MFFLKKCKYWYSRQIHDLNCEGIHWKSQEINLFTCAWIPCTNARLFSVFLQVQSVFMTTSKTWSVTVQVLISSIVGSSSPQLRASWVLPFRKWHGDILYPSQSLMHSFFSSQGTFAFSLIKYTPLKYNNEYVYPWWGYAIGWLLALSSMVCIPLWMVYKIGTSHGTIKEVRVSMLCMTVFQIWVLKKTLKSSQKNLPPAHPVANHTIWQLT